MGPESVLSRRALSKSPHERGRWTLGRIPGAAGVASDVGFTGCGAVTGVVGERGVCRHEFHASRRVSDVVDDRVDRLSTSLF